MTFPLVNPNYVICHFSQKEDKKKKKTTPATPPELLHFNKTCRDVTNDAVIMWVVHSKVRVIAVFSSKCSADCEETLLDQVSSEALQVKTSNLASNCLFNPPPANNLRLRPLHCKKIWKPVWKGSRHLRAKDVTSAATRVSIKTKQSKWFDIQGRTSIAPVVRSMHRICDVN